MRHTMVFKVKILLPISALLAGILSGCAGIKKPDSDICTINVPGLRENCHNLARDYDDLGRLKPGTKMEVRQYDEIAQLLMGVESKDPKEKRTGINKKTCMDPQSLANLKAYIKKLREAYETQN